MMKYALVVSFVIATLTLPGGLAYSADQAKTGTQETSKKELQIKAPTQQTRSIEEKEQMLKGDFLSEMEHFFESQLPMGREEWRHPRYWRRPLLGALVDRLTLPVDVIEQESNFLITAELPGVDKKDIYVTIADNTVTIEADTSKEDEVEKSSYYRREISRGAYRRTLMLPATLDGGEAKASFKNGVLQLTIPKVKATKSTTIKVE